MKPSNEELVGQKEPEPGEIWVPKPPPVSLFGNERYDWIFQHLPPLTSGKYLAHLKTATAKDLPAPVLVRAYRALSSGPAADATLGRLLGFDNEYGYLTPLWRAANRRISRSDPYSPEDLVLATIGKVVETIGGKQGEGADKAWVSYLEQRMEDAYREMVGKSKRKGRRANPMLDEETEEEHEVYEMKEVPRGPYQGNAEGSSEDLEWLADFVRRKCEEIRDVRKREVALDVFSELLDREPTPVSSEDPKDPSTLAGRYGVRRQTIYEWQRQAKTLVLAELKAQKERPLFGKDFVTRLLED